MTCCTCAMIATCCTCTMIVTCCTYAMPGCCRCRSRSRSQCGIGCRTCRRRSEAHAVRQKAEREQRRGQESKDRLQGEGIAGSIIRVVALFQVLPYPHEHRRLSSVAAGMRVRMHAAAPITQACAHTKCHVSVWRLRQAPMTQWRGAGQGWRRGCAPRASNATRASYATRARAVALLLRC